jgi:hypothetical protein
MRDAERCRFVTNERGVEASAPWTPLQSGPCDWAWGTLPAALALEPAFLVGLGASVMTSPLAWFRSPYRPFGVMDVLYAAVWIAVSVGSTVRFRRCRQRSRLAGLKVLVVVPESPRLLAWLCRRHAINLPRRRVVCTVHVDPEWRPTGPSPPTSAAAEFSLLYRKDYDTVLQALRGRPVLICSSTFNRHESQWTARAEADGAVATHRGPLFTAAPWRNGPRPRERQQRRMFGERISRRRVDHPLAWRTRIFDCLRLSAD